MAGDPEKFTARRRGVTSPCPAPRSLSASPAANGPSPCNVFPRNLARSSLAAFSLALALSGNESPPPSTSSVGPERSAARTSAA